MSEIAICDDDGCGIELDDDQLTSCSGDPFPWLGVRQHCPSCRRECGPCQDEAAREWQDEQREDIRRYGA